MSGMKYVIDESRRHSLLSETRLISLWRAAESTWDLPGCNAEVGVYRGGSALVIAHASDRDLYLFDTFKGLPKPNRKYDRHKEGEFFDTSVEKVSELLDSKDDVHVHFYVGVFPGSARNVPSDIQFKFVHIDCDLYESVMESLKFFWFRMPIGGIMVIDDYGWHMCPGAKKAVTEYFYDCKKGDVALSLVEHQGILRKEDPKGVKYENSEANT